jgi:hypothetical protein
MQHRTHAKVPSESATDSTPVRPRLWAHIRRLISRKRPREEVFVVGTSTADAFLEMKQVPVRLREFQSPDWPLHNYLSRKLQRNSVLILLALGRSGFVEPHPSRPSPAVEVKRSSRDFAEVCLCETYLGLREPRLFVAAPSDTSRPTVHSRQSKMEDFVGV